MFARLLDIIWPRPCEVCGRPTDRPGRHLCSDCLMRLPFVPTDGLCRRCGREAMALDGEFLCQDCRERRPAFDRAASVWRFDVEARDIILNYKFKSHIWLRDDFVEALEGLARTHFKFRRVDAVVPMPSTRLHRFLRGYNPCAIFASALARRLERPLLAHTLVRCGHPKKQAGLDEEARRKNVVGTFAVRHPEGVSGKTLLVVDDIMTTGSTLSEAARTLKAAGARHVWCVTLARTPRLI